MAIHTYWNGATASRTESGSGTSATLLGLLLLETGADLDMTVRMDEDLHVHCLLSGG